MLCGADWHHLVGFNRPSGRGNVRDSLYRWQSGTTGLQIRNVDRHPGGDQPGKEDRLSIEARREILRRPQFLPPDAAAREAASLSGGKTRLIDASTAHRVHADWQYGLPELSQDQPSIIAGANRVANPGCYPTGFILLTKPLVDAGLLSADQPVSVNAVSGYSGGGKTLIASFEDAGAESPIESSIYTYALELEHKHVPEMTVHTGLANPPLFTPRFTGSIRGCWFRFLGPWALPGNPTADQIRAPGGARGKPIVQVASHAETIDAKRLDPEEQRHERAQDPRCLQRVARTGCARLALDNGAQAQPFRTST